MLEISESNAGTRLHRADDQAEGGLRWKLLEDDTDLAAALRALRPTPRPEFAAELDARAAAGFPARVASGDRRAAPRSAQRLRDRPRRGGCWPPAARLAVAAVVDRDGAVGRDDRERRSEPQRSR